MFADGTAVYDAFARDYITHSYGLFILAPSGVGKSHYVRGQADDAKHWIDADVLWRKARAMPAGAWWEQLELIEGIEQQCDIITAQAKKLGFWMLGSACSQLKPDAVVLPKWDIHVAYIKKRELNYDGGITSAQLQQLKNHRAEISGWVTRGVPEFESVDDAITHLTSTNQPKP